MTDTKPTLDQLLARFKGHRGDTEAESILNDSNFDKAANTVSVWSNKNDAAKIIERCRQAIVDYQVVGNGITLVLDRSFFRGIEYAFRPTH